MTEYIPVPNGLTSRSQGPVIAMRVDDRGVIEVQYAGSSLWNLAMTQSDLEVNGRSYDG
jgi:hypothetical protein